MTLKSFKENAIIRVTALHRSGGEEEKIEFVTVGAFFARGGKFYIFDEETEQIGMADSTVMLICEQDQVTFKRSGSGRLKFTYVEGESENVLYYFPFGAVNMTQTTSKVRCGLDDAGGSVELEYTLCMGKDKQENLLDIKVERQK